ncbi:hypothetical protein WK11_12245 [Burkholderia ubonensis]|nr:hypothetical protein WI81_11255 [Burkholderia ubonensis]KVD81141.1 hypothetical protein WI88_19445 [Burkholderia ubonensis]KVL07644.1 hypothetical protein WJ45_07650 [Burkholderia ubonensis]KVN36635.1 hypothetical protein WJ64_06190 [Burkholderia ubonensis]KVO04998.1 hypothetical protein WJ70_27495 [Burkholderia ubonensis]
MAFPADATAKVPNALAPAAVALELTPSATELMPFETVPPPSAIEPCPVAAALWPSATVYCPFALAW